MFSSLRTDVEDGYHETALRMLALAAEQPGYLGVEGVREGLGITISYWDSLEAIRNWKQVAEHQIAQQKGRTDWYSAYKTRICKVERDYGFEK
ncbi:MAG: antibiotic biosynthesis monooxygenase [Saprospiraceae bacterium]|nr:antibiotic biosynthesis monooxygenase [Saprospiraceae bacterium]